MNESMTTVEQKHVRLIWGVPASRTQRAGWIDLRPADTVQDNRACDIIRDGLPVRSDSVDYISSPHAIERLSINEIDNALREMRRVLKPGGVLRLCLVDFDKAIDAYLNKRDEYLWCRAWDSFSGNFLTQFLNYNDTRTPMTREFLRELLTRAGFARLCDVSYHESTSGYPDITAHDDRPDETFFLEAYKPDSPPNSDASPAESASQVHLSWFGDPSTTLTVTWHSPASVPPPELDWRRLGDDTGQSAAAEPVPSFGRTVLYRAHLTGLQPDTEYEYRVWAGGRATASGSRVFRTRTAPPRGPADFKFAFICDTGLIGRPDGIVTGTGEILDEINAHAPLFVLGGGDYAYFNGDDRFADAETSVNAWFEQMEPMIARFPFMAQYGNHDVSLDERYRDWAPRFAHPEGFDDGRNYSFEIGDVHFTGLFVPDFPLLGPQLAWLDADLAAARQNGSRWVILFQHAPLFADGHSHPSIPEIREQLAPILERHHVDLHLSGHDQNYSRTYPLVRSWIEPTPASRSTDRYPARSGVIYAQVSPSGKMSDIRNQFSRFRSPQPNYVAARDDTRHHYALVSVSAAGEMKFDAFGVIGDGTPATLLDSFCIVQPSDKST